MLHCLIALVRVDARARGLGIVHGHGHLKPVSIDEVDGRMFATLDGACKFSYESA
jgi:hypothetical protein